MDHNRNNKHYRGSEHDWQQAMDVLPILIIERNEASVMGTDALIAAAKTGLRDACENYRPALIEHRGT
ncbi:hypothetical protein [Stenotrophomonas maltophilia]|uniref:Uncharacterized protein n=1 Tax=Stenotrophomonas maltophilia TaxID=40324 RepID=A0A246I6U1_STEMA|nr:hypothetical protein [Stenotrophomonas maltophilia]OWQ74532.1 hypothetical protein CEE63_10265 [Stenotrophomonas maltophilia]